MAAPDGEWGWVVVFGAGLTFFICGGIERSFGVWYVDILERYEAGAALTSWCIGIHVTCRQMFYLFAAILYFRTSARILIMIGGLLLSTGLFISAFAGNIFVFYATFGLIGGLGSGMAVFSAQMAVSEYFDKRKFLAIGLAMCGSGFGTFTLSSLLSHLLLNVTYFESVIIVSGIALNALIGGAVCFPVYEPIKDSDQQPLLPDERPDEQKPLIDKDKITSSYSKKLEDVTKQISHAGPRFRVRKLVGKRNFEVDMLKNPLVIFYTIGAFLSILGSFSIPQLIVDDAVEQGIPFEQASSIITIAGILEIISRFSLSFIFNLEFIRLRAVIIWNLSFVGFSICALAIAFSSEFWQFIPSMFINVVCHAISRGFAVVMLASVFEPTAFASVFAVYNFFIGLGTFFGTVFVGYLKDISGSYFISYLTMSLFCFSSSCFYFLNSFLFTKLRNNPKYRLLRSSDE